MKIIVYTKPNCTECERIKNKLEEKGLDFESINMDTLEVNKQFELKKDARENRQRSMPLVYVNDKFTRTEDFESKYL